MRELGLQQPSDAASAATGRQQHQMLALPPPQAASSPIPPPSGSASIAPDPSAADSGMAPSGDSEVGSVPGASAPQLRAYRSLESSSVIFLQELLSAIEPVVFTKHALSIVTRRGARLQNIKSLCEIIELCTGMAGTEQIIVGDDQGVTAVLKLRLSELNLGFGRRGLETPLPPDWATHGVYRIVLESGGGLKVMNRFTNICKTIKAPELKRVDKRLVYVHDNFSERRATLKAKGSIMNILLYPIFEPAAFQGFASAADATPPPKRRRQGLLALADVSTGAASSRTLLRNSAPPPVRASAARTLTQDAMGASVAQDGEEASSGGEGDDRRHTRRGGDVARDGGSEGDGSSAGGNAADEGDEHSMGGDEAGDAALQEAGELEGDMIPPPPPPSGAT